MGKQYNKTRSRKLKLGGMIFVEITFVVHLSCVGNKEVEGRRTHKKYIIDPF